jgi:hypothetical protein
MRIAYGACCTWWGPIDQVSLRFLVASRAKEPDTHQVPCCPECGGMLFEMDSEERWWNGVDKYNEEHPGYRRLVTWAKGKCFRTWLEAKEAYECRGRSNED